MCKSLEKSTRYSIIEYATIWERYFGQTLKKSLGFILGDDGTMKIIKRNGTEAVFDIAKIRMAIQKANEEAVSSERLTPEQIDKIAKNIETACLLIQQDHNYFKEFVLENKAINIVTKKGSLLNYAIQLKDNEIAEWLIEEKIDINSFDGLELLTALKMNNTRIALQLLRHGIITDGDEMKSNPLLFAIKIGSRELVEELMTKHRHLVAVYTNEYVKNYTILDIAKRYKNDQIIQTVKKYL